ncbi:formylglycine-generating enzyme family protein [Paucibacter sp. DJ1R-11]|uniref:formylglycine-generating enzyme family protein n=1 Tax=Paucibacter sp. DJ1R-11 TaxID=2893556 RepID=UPI0021E39F8C|nr:formylglycine-generating enzyme family protein [Paucibacter sp. DJ1R-11]MCV2362178.1 formylglycine-generating enzyme family protein [Paucibacter sp. DJ1R-11]
MWPSDQAWRAPVGDFPPPWASAWGDDQFGLWADLTVKGVTQRLRWIEPSGPEGFWMGAPQKERDAIEQADVQRWANEHESEPFRVVLDAGFWLADTPCTQAFWLAVMGDKPSRFSDQPNADQLPVEQVSWHEIERFILRFAATPDWACEDLLGLPTERQWEYAARAGSRSAYWWGDRVDSVMASWEQGGTTPVKRYPANPWGLFDVHSNVLEWCADLWQPRLDKPEAELGGASHVVRGGSWINHPAHSRSAYRGKARLGVRRRDLGFRFALRSSSQPGVEPLGL